MRFSALALTLLLASSFLFSGCGFARKGPEAGTLRVNIGTEPESLDWDLTTDPTAFDVVVNLMVGLTQYRKDLTLRPCLAKSWDVSKDGMHYVFHIAPNVFWSDGKRLTAHDFEYSWIRLLKPSTGSPYAYFLYDIEGAYAYNTGKAKDARGVGVKALDDNTLSVTLARPAAYFLCLTAFPPTYPIRQDVVERFGNRWTEPGHIVTAGPFLLNKWEHEYKIELKRNPLYFEGESKLKKIKMFMVAEQSTAFALYENDELDFVDNRSISTADIERVQNSPEYHNFPLFRNNYVGFNVDKKPFCDKRVRLAFAMAIDRNVFPRVLRRHELPTDHWIPKGMLGQADSSGPGFHPELARKLLSDAGFPNGAGFPQVSMLYPSREDTKLIVEAIQDQLKRNLHIRIDLVNEEMKVYLSTMRLNPPPLFRATWGADYADPETFMNIFVDKNSNNYTRWTNPGYKALIAKAESDLNPQSRGNYYRQADELLCKDEAAIAPIFLATQNLMVKPWVHGIESNPLDFQFYKDVVIESPPASLEQTMPKAGPPPLLPGVR